MQKRRQGLAAVLLFVLFFCLSGCGRRQEEPEIYEAGPETEPVTIEAAKTVSEAEQIKRAQEPFGYVYVCGAVKSPGVYPLHENMRVFEAIEAAGGFLPEADEAWLNQAGLLQDGQQLYVYTREETQATEMPRYAEESRKAEPDKVNLNTADEEELMTLPGIGEAKAGAIVQYRTQHGGFSSIEEIQEIPGIKQAVFSKIENQITV